MKKHTKKEEKEMFRKELMKAGLIVAISILSLVGCSGEEEPKPSETTSVEASTDEQEPQKETQAETQEPTDEQITGDVGVGKFDPADVCKNISINGEVVEFPWTLNKLGEEYEFDEVVNDVQDDGMSAAYLMYKGEEMFIVSIKDEEVDRDSLITFIMFDVYDKVTLYDFGTETKEEDVFKIFGEPYNVSKNSLVINYQYISEEAYIGFNFDAESKRLDSITLDLTNICQ